MATLIESVRENIDSVLKIRDDLGAIKAEVFFKTRSWDGGRLGLGVATETITQILPSPSITRFEHRYSMKEIGRSKDGDLLLKAISINKYPNEADVLCRTNSKNIEKFYFIDGELYSPVSVEKKYFYWNVVVRKSQRR